MLMRPIVAALLLSTISVVQGCASRDTVPPPLDTVPYAGYQASITAPGAGDWKTGRLIFFISDSCGSPDDPGDPEPRFADPIAKPEPVLGIDLRARPEEPEEPFVVTFADLETNRSGAYAFQVPIDRIDPKLCVQAVLDVDTFRRSYNTAGNFYSVPQRVGEVLDNSSGLVSVNISQVISADVPAPSKWIETVEIHSRLLSDFHGRDVYLRAAVVFPLGYDPNGASTYPVIYRIPGLYGRHTNAWDWIMEQEGVAWRQDDWPIRALLVFLDPDVPLGHSTFANSENNGPVGTALVEELIPAIERRFVQGDPESVTRFLSGHSSGGWASLWLQIQYPGLFDGTWSTAPDPVDFRAFQLIDIYSDTNAYTTAQ